uniref:F-box protein At3g07870-like n=1 Tax=Erigeron canadensis TaxID=72917 RepID=UPI001CB94F99|nr:F-box protein At3g07870-like [Erigeron canadensis]
MSDIPLEIQMEIIQRIPDIKWVIRCRSVSKSWKYVIDSKDFVTGHTLRHQVNRHHLLIRTQDRDDKKVKYVTLLDDDTFPHQKINVFVPDAVNKFSSDSEIIGTCHGLFCLYEREADTTVIWNPLVRKTVTIAVPNKWDRYFGTIIGFGLCSSNLDPKLVKITYVYYPDKLQDVNTRTHVEVFTLSSGRTWRSPLSGNVPSQSIKIGYSQAVIDGVIYWKAVDRNIHVDDRRRTPNLIVSFDLTSEEFTKVNLPDPLTLSRYADLSVSNLRESLAVLKFDMYTPREFCDVWMMIGQGCTRSFNKLYSISAPHALIGTTVGFRKSGEPIIEYNRYTPNELAIYEPESKHITNIGIHGLDGTFFVHSYMETLLLLGH